MILLGAVLRETGCVKDESLEEGLRQVIPARKADMFELNMRAIQAGRDYKG